MERRRRAARIAIWGGGAAAALGLATVGVMLGQAEAARRTIPLAIAPPPRSDGLYGGRQGGVPLRMVMLGDSSAAGLGALRARQTPAALIATGLSRRLGRPVLLHSLAVVGSTSLSMLPQVEEALELHPELAVILIGANDITHRAGTALAVRHLADSVRRLRETGAEVVVGTCPDLGAVQPIRAPLRWVARSWSRQLAAAQTVAVVEAGGRTVSLGDLLGPTFSAQPHRMFARDRFHPSAEGYALAASVLLPTVVAALRAPSGPQAPQEGAKTAADGVRSLPQAAVEAARHAGTEVSGVRVEGRDRGPAGRWAQLRRRVWEVVRPAEAPWTAGTERTADISEAQA
ncbi:SGNH/GDSL hydrolase family protein [Catellatospora sp. KI3]|uniref:SGNH/GDSL hydrolase family protein n=1 Tax=Catellatospora sp. KI3 TaxID=3041620 RepID=UPI002482F4E1|nr:SGNH/GDSL hydrolase family protein [Catellatospora sp. KI3]MDI1460423.1 SGNH/GDSL hydrolase family protein [Catellatospora sp. KI3]